MNPGDILLFKAESDLLSKLVAWGTNSKYSHVAVCVSSEMNLAIEAMAGGGVRARDIRKIKESYDVYRVKASYNLDETISYLVGSLNTGYDYFEIGSVPFANLNSNLSLKLNLKVSPRKG